MDWKKALKAILTVLALTLMVTLAVEIFDGLYDMRLALGVIAGATLYGKVYSLIEKLNILE